MWGVVQHPPDGSSALAMVLLSAAEWAADPRGAWAFPVGLLEVSFGGRRKAKDLHPASRLRGITRGNERPLLARWGGRDALRLLVKVTRTV